MIKTLNFNFTRSELNSKQLYILSNIKSHFKENNCLKTIYDRVFIF